MYNFYNCTGTVTSVGLCTGTAGSDLNVTGTPVTGSGNITLNVPTASATNEVLYHLRIGLLSTVKLIA